LVLQNPVCVCVCGVHPLIISNFQLCVVWLWLMASKQIIDVWIWLMASSSSSQTGESPPAEKFRPGGRRPQSRSWPNGLPFSPIPANFPPPPRGTRELKKPPPTVQQWPDCWCPDPTRTQRPKVLISTQGSVSWGDKDKIHTRNAYKRRKKKERKKGNPEEKTGRETEGKSETKKKTKKGKNGKKKKKGEKKQRQGREEENRERERERDQERQKIERIRKTREQKGKLRTEASSSWRCTEIFVPRPFAKQASVREQFTHACKGKTGRITGLNQ